VGGNVRILLVAVVAVAAAAIAAAAGHPALAAFILATWVHLVVGFSAVTVTGLLAMMVSDGQSDQGVSVEVERPGDTQHSRT